MTQDEFPSLKWARGDERARQDLTLTKFKVGDACVTGSAIQCLFSLLLSSYSGFDPRCLLIWVCAFTFVVTVQEGRATGTWHVLCISKFSVVAALRRVIVAGSLPAKTLLQHESAGSCFPIVSTLLLPTTEGDQLFLDKAPPSSRLLVTGF